jgi:hypothetical protein
MAAGDKNYKVHVAISLIPIEETVLADGSTKVQNLHSLIDKSEGGQQVVLGMPGYPDSVVLYEKVLVPQELTDLATLLSDTFISVEVLFLKIVPPVRTAPYPVVGIYSADYTTCLSELSEGGSFAYLYRCHHALDEIHVVANASDVYIDVLLAGNTGAR